MLGKAERACNACKEESTQVQCSLKTFRTPISNKGIESGGTINIVPEQRVEVELTVKNRRKKISCSENRTAIAETDNEEASYIIERVGQPRLISVSGNHHGFERQTFCFAHAF